MATPALEDPNTLVTDARLDMSDDDAAKALADSRSARGGGDLDVFSNITEAKPGTIPLLVRGLDGEQSQIDVPLTSTVDDISAMIRPGQSADDLRLTFGNEDLRPGASLLDTNIVDAYEHAGSLLALIGSSGGDPAAKTAALNSACAVIENVSNGVKDMEALCAAAVDPSLSISMSSDPRIAQLVAEGAAQADRETPKELDASEFKLLNAMLTRPDKALQQENIDAPPHKPATPAELALGLSRRLPLLFPPKAAAVFADAESPSLDAPQEGELDPSHTVRISAAAQPSISAIREARAARRKERQLMIPLEEAKLASEAAANAITIGNSTNGMPLPANLPGRSGNLEVTTGVQRPGGGSLLMAADAKSTWLEDVMKTWEVGVVRESGVLEKTKNGQELNEYFDGLEAEAQRDLETELVETETAEVLQKNKEKDKESKFEGNTEEESEEDDVDEEDDEGRNDTMGNGGKSGLEANSDVKMTEPCTGVTSPLGKNTISSASESSQTQIMDQRLQSPDTETSRLSTTSSMSSQPLDSTKSIKPSAVKPPFIRQAKKIAPAPHVPLGTIGVAVNGIYPGPILPSGEAPPGIPFPPRTTPPARKKRGRKRKHPELSDEERALYRKEQNRESAKLSRVRRKVIAAEYEGRLNRLLGENTQLRKEVEGLNNRLVYLQSLLTVSVRQDGNTKDS